MKTKNKKYNHLASLVFKFINKECYVNYGNCFAYDPTCETIIFNLDEDIIANQQWKIFLKYKFNFTLTKENIFTLSILHELGHHYTENLFSDEEWECQASESTLTETDELKIQQEYFNLPIELAATEWAVNTYRASLDDMRIWNHRFTCAIKHLQKKENKKFLTNF